MAKNLKRLCALVLALVMCGSMFCTTAFAAETVNGNTWYGKDVAVDVTAGTDGYTFMSLFRKYVHGYEFGGHFLGDGEGPQTFVVIDTVAHDGTTWTPNGIYDPMKSNYDVTYCCDVETMIKDATYYKRLNLEDSEYYNAEQAAKIRAIVTNAYPYVSLEDMKADLKENGYQYADQLTRNEILAAVQAAIWASANGMTAEDFRYVKSYKVSDNLQWGYPMHDTSNESGLDVSGTRVFKTYEEVGTRIDSLVDYLLAQDKVYAEKAQIIITKLELDGDPVKISDTQAQVKLNLELNNSGSGYDDKINVTIKCDDEVVKTFPVELGVEKYTLNIVTGLKSKISAEVSGTQVLPAGVYFYAPKAADVDGDGVATSREVSQNLVGVAMGATPVSAYDELDLGIIDIPVPPTPPTGEVIVPDIPVDKKADGLDSKDQTNVTLTVGGESETAPVDVVIALGAGIADLDNTRESMINLIKPLVEKGIPVKLGLVAVEHYKDVAMGLTELNAENYVEIINSGLATIKSLPAGPTNLHSNIEAAKAMLDADGAVMAENKYFYVIATGRTYNYDNEYGAPTTIINTVDLNGQHYYYWGHYLWQSQRGQHTSLYRVPTSYNNNFAAYWADVEKWVKADGDTYAYTFPIASYDDPQWFNNYMAENSSDAKALGLASSRFGWIIHDLTGKTVAAIDSSANPAHALNYERAQYEAYYAYKAMVDAGYKCQALCSESVSYQNYSPYMSVQGVTPGIQLGHSFMDHMAKLSGQEAATVLFQLTDNSGNYKTAENFFTAIEPVAGAATVPAGSYVEDFIGKNENGNFEFKPEAKYLTLVNNGVTYKAAEVDAKEGADASFTFTAPEATEPTFTLDYYYGDGKTTEKFVWTFGEDITGTITLTYKLQLIGKQEAEGNYTVNTNNSATLYPAGGEEKEFPIPTVDYEVKKEEIDPAPPMEMGEKTSKEIGENRFEVSIDVPGMDGYTIHDEVILMVDGSYSGNSEWNGMKAAINAIGETVLNGSGSTKLTLMAFGMGDNFVLERISDAAELANALGALPGNLLRGVSSTNCEAGFTGVDEYIRSRKADLHDAIVIYITDGGINTDETPRDFYHWRKYAPNADSVRGYAIDGADTALLQAAILSVKGVASAALDTCTTDELNAVTDYIWATIFEYSGMTPGKEYPISEAERAFLKYDEDHGSMTRYSFLLAMKNSSFDKYPNVWNRTYNAVFDLAENALVKDLYLVRYQNDGRATWMPDAAAKSDSDKIHYVKSDSITSLLGALDGTLGELSITPFNDVVVTDYMSKWVNLDASTLKIVDNTTGEAIWTAADGWLISENRPTAKEVPVVVELVDPADYAAGGEDVIGNTNGNIYKLTWYVKDGAMLRADTYALKYEVDVDTAEEGFVDNTNYPANGTTNLTYKDEDGKEQTNEIKVPDVHGVKPVPEIPEIPTVSFKSGDASNISFMLIDKETGEVEFLVKYDIGNETSYEIPTEEGKISAVFIKQSTSGMFWTSEEVSNEVLSNVIECLKDNNPSYKGHNAVASGEGQHQLEFKKNKFVTYTFAATAVDIEDEDVPGAATPATETLATETLATETLATETPATEAPATEPEHDFHATGNNHLLIDEADPISFNLDTTYQSTVDDKYAFIGHGEMSEFWPAILYYRNGVGEPVATINGTALYNKGKGANINGIYLDGVFYPGTVKAYYESVQQPVLMNGAGKAVAVYCADKATGTQTNTLYDVVNLENAEHFSAKTAAKLRAIAVNGYWGGTDSVDPTGSLAKMKAMMKASGDFTQEEIDHLSSGVALAATQFAIWELANHGEESQIVNVQYLVENRVAYHNGKSYNTLIATPESEIACVDLIFKLSKYLTELPGISVKEMTTANTVLNYKNILQDVTIVPLQKAEGHVNNTDDNKDNDAYDTNVIFQMLPISEKDNLTAKIIDKVTKEVYAESNIAELQNNGDGTYTFPNVVLVENNVNNYTVVVEGVQYLERNVYLYFAGERGASQTMIGYDEGEFSVNVESTVEKTFNVDEPETPPTVTFEKGDASNISFMLIDAEGNVEFLKKYDIGNETSYEIPTEEGKISAVFIKQSTSGMFWFSQEVSDEVLNNVIECLKDNNPSYKGYDAVAFGKGDHELEFKKNKFVTYTFSGEIADIAVNVAVVAEEETEATETETPATTETPAETEAPAEPEATEPETPAAAETPAETEAPAEPEATETETPEPEVTEPEVTEPEASEPVVEETEPEVEETKGNGKKNK